jgi:hypothetical protein
VFRLSANREPTPNQVVLWTIDDLAAYLRCSVAQAYKTVALQSIPRVEVFRRGMRLVLAQNKRPVSNYELLNSKLPIALKINIGGEV